MVLFRSARKSPNQLDINFLTHWDQKYWMGLAYRNSGRTWVESANGGDYKEINLSLANSYFIVSAGLRIMNNLDLGYAYEISNSNLYQQSNGTHELMLVYTFGGRGKDGKPYDKIIDALKENQKKLNDQLETITEKVDENLAETKKTTEIAEANQEKLDVLNEKVENMPAGVEFSGDTAGVYALIAKIDQFNKQLEALDSRDGEQQKLLTDLNAEIAALRSELGTKSGGTTSIPTVVLTGDQNTVYFSTGSYQLSYESKLKLQKMIIYLNQNKSSKIQINGFTDEVGDEEYNKSLSASRAKTVYDYFIANGVDKERMTYTGMGEDAPQTSNKTYEGRVLNRRVEVALLK